MGSAQSGDGLGEGEGLIKQKALSLRHAMVDLPVPLSRLLDTFGGHGHAQVVEHGEHGA